MTTLVDAELEQLIRLVTTTAAVDIPPTFMPAVIDNVRILMAHAALVMSFSLAEASDIDAGSASMFEP